MDIQYDKSLYVLDNHCHVSFPQPIEESYSDYSRLFRELGICEAALLSCPPSGHGETPMDVLENMKVLYLKDRFPFPTFAYASFTEHWDAPGKYADFARSMLDMGFDGFKTMDGHPKCRKVLGKGLNHPSFAEFFEMLNEHQLPIVCHVGDPRPNWCAETADESAKRLGRLYGDDFLSLDALYAEMEEVIAKYPHAKFIMAHFYFVSDDYQRACRLMEQYPQLYFDLAPGGEMFVNFSKDPQKWRDFFIRYRKRILLGGDHYPAGYARHRYGLARDFLEGTEPTAYRNAPVFPIHLPQDVLQDIYCNNAHRLTGNVPKPVDRQLAYQHCCYIRDNLIDQLGEMGKANLQTIMAYFQDA